MASRLLAPLFHGRKSQMAQARALGRYRCPPIGREPRGADFQAGVQAGARGPSDKGQHRYKHRAWSWIRAPMADQLRPGRAQDCAPWIQHLPRFCLLPAAEFRGNSSPVTPRQTCQASSPSTEGRPP